MAAVKTILTVAACTQTRDEIYAQLRHAGYEPVSAPTTDDAYALLQEDPKIDLLLADLQAPGQIDAITLVERARSLRPDLQILLTTELDRFAQSADRHAGVADSLMITMLKTLLEKP